MYRNLASLWMYREFIIGSVKRDFHSRYSNSILGALWAVLNPLAMVFIYTVIFSQVMRAKLPGIDSQFGYSIYLCAGVLTWAFFSEILNRSQTVFVENANLIKKVNFPRICLPAIVVINAGINFLIIFSLFTLVLIAVGEFPGVVMLAIFPLVFVLIMFAIGLGITLGVVNVFFRDVGQFVGIFLQFWFWFTPIVYPVGIVPEQFRQFLVLNPMVALVGAFQGVLLDAEWPHWNELLYVTSLSVVACFLGFRLFGKLSSDMVDEL